jgi:hypothetical protein
MGVVGVPPAADVDDHAVAPGLLQRQVLVQHAGLDVGVPIHDLHDLAVGDREYRLAVGGEIRKLGVIVGEKDMSPVVGLDPVDGEALRRKELLVEGLHGATVGRKRAAAVGRHPVLAFDGRAYDDWLVVQDLGATTNICGLLGEEVASESGGMSKLALTRCSTALGTSRRSSRDTSIERRTSEVGRIGRPRS